MIGWIACGLAALAVCGAFADGMAGAPYAFERRRLFSGFDGKHCKVQPTIATDGKGTAFLTFQKLLLTGSDVFYGQFMSKSIDGGRTWSEPVEQTALKDTHEAGLRVARYAAVHYSAKNGR